MSGKLVSRDQQPTGSSFNFIYFIKSAAALWKNSNILRCFQGMINLGFAESTLVEDLLEERVHT